MDRYLVSRRYWLVPIMVWALLALLSFSWSRAEFIRHDWEIVLNRGRLVFHTVEIVRLWNAQHGGVYAPVSPSTLPNPYLEIPEREITTPAGVLLTKINPAYMTRQLSELFRRHKDLRIRLTSLRPLNPANRPDPWEEAALHAFEQGKEEVAEQIDSADGGVIRYMAPLWVRPPCLECHVKQGYREGDLRGGVGISFPALSFTDGVRRHTLNLGLLHLGGWFLLSLVTVLLLFRIRRQILSLRDLNEQQHLLVEERTRELQAEVMTRRLSEERLRWVSHSMMDAVVAIDLQGRINFWNQGACTIFGYTEEEIVGKPVTWLMPESYRERHSTAFARLQASRQMVVGHTVELEGQRKNGEIFPLEISLVSWHVAGERFFSAVIRDISERQQAQQALDAAKQRAEAASQAKSAFLAVVSHEIRTPLNAVIGMSELLEESPLQEEQRRFLRTIRSAGESLQDVIESVLDMAKIESGRMELNQVPFSLREMMEGACAVVTPHCRRRDLQFLCLLPEEMPDRWLGDPIRLRQIVLNLLGNAAKFTEKGEVRLEFLPPLGAPGEEGRQRLSFMVSDTGIGITEADQKTIFDQFVQADSSISRRFGGTGLGLAICRRLAEMMGGGIRVESQVGQGSRFIVEVMLELVLEEAPIPPESPLPHPGVTLPVVGERKNPTILVVEDSEDNRLLLHSYFARTAYRLTFAENGAQAVALFMAQPFDLVLMDIQMPVMDGLEATRRIRLWESEQQRVPTPILALTADALRDHFAWSLEAGCNAHITKPIRKKNLLVLVEQWIQPVPLMSEEPAGNGLGEAGLDGENYSI